MTSEAIIGRSEELAAIETIIAQSGLNRTQLLWLSAEPGAGKSRLVQEVAFRATRQGIRVLQGAAWELGGAPGYWLFRQVVSSLTDDERTFIQQGLSSKRAQFTQLFARFCAGEGEEHLAQNERFAMFEAIALALRVLSERQPLLLVFEDLHAADEDSLVMLRFVLRDQTPRAMTVLATTRFGEARTSVIAEHLATLAQDAMLVGLRPMDKSSIAQWSKQWLQQPLSDDELAAVVQASGGNALFIRLLLLVARTDGIDRVLRTPPSEILSAVELRLRKLGAESQDVLRHAALIGLEFSSELLKDVSLHAGSIVEAAMREGLVHGLLVGATNMGDFRFAHALVHEALTRQTPAPLRLEIQRRIAQCMDRRSAGSFSINTTVDELARRFREVAHSDEIFREKAIQYTIVAAANAARAMAHQHAARLYAEVEKLLQDRQEGTVEPSEQLLEILIARANAEHNAGQTQDATELFLRVCVKAERTLLHRLFAEGVLGFARSGEYMDYNPDKIRWLRLAIDRLPESEFALRARCLARLAGELRKQQLNDSGTRESERVALAQTAIAVARESGDSSAQAQTIDGYLESIYGPESIGERLRLGTELVQLARASGNDDALLDGFRWVLSARMEMGQLSLARPELAEHYRIASRRMQPRTLANAVSRASTKALLEGNLAQCERLSWWTWELENQSHTGPAADLFLAAQLAVFRAETAQLSALEKSANIMRDSAERLNRPFLLAFATWALLRAGRRKEGQALYDRCVLGGPEYFPKDFAVLFAWSAIAQSALMLEDTATAQLFGQQLVPYSERVAVCGTASSFGPIALVLSQISQQAGDSESALKWATQSAALCAKEGIALYSAMSEWHYAQVLLLDRGSSAQRMAQEALSRAKILADRHQLTTLRERLIGPTASQRPSTPVVEDASLSLEGAVWALTFAKHTVRVKDSRGMQYVAKLLREPKQEQPVVLLSETVVESSADGPVLDAQAKRQYQERIHRLREELEEAEEFGQLERVARAKEELELLGDELARAVGLGRRDRVQNTTQEKARMRVTQAIRRAIANVTELHPKAGSHLQSAIRTGAFCAYDPDPSLQIRWKVSAL